MHDLAKDTLDTYITDTKEYQKSLGHIDYTPIEFTLEQISDLCEIVDRSAQGNSSIAVQEFYDSLGLDARASAIYKRLAGYDGNYTIERAPISILLPKDMHKSIEGFLNYKIPKELTRYFFAMADNKKEALNSMAKFAKFYDDALTSYFMLRRAYSASEVLANIELLNALKT